MATGFSSTFCKAGGSLAELSSSRGAVNGVFVSATPRVSCAKFSRSTGVVLCAARNDISDIVALSRRSAIALFAGAVTVSSRVNPAEAAYGEAANIFASPKNESGFVPYSGEGFQVNLPAKWNPSKEVEFPGQVLRYEDNFDATNNLSVSIVKTDKSSIADYGSPEELLKSLSYLLGKQSYSGKTSSEGGFADSKVSTAAILETKVKELNGKTYYGVSVLTRTADGDEGGKHQLIVATIDGGKLYIVKAQAGDKRWFKGAKKFVEGVVSSFNVV